MEICDIWLSIGLLRHLGLVNFKAFTVQNGEEELGAEMNFLRELKAISRG